MTITIRVLVRLTHPLLIFMLGLISLTIKLSAEIQNYIIIMYIMRSTNEKRWILDWLFEGVSSANMELIKKMPTAWQPIYFVIRIHNDLQWFVVDFITFGQIIGKRFDNINLRYYGSFGSVKWQIVQPILCHGTDVSGRIGTTKTIFEFDSVLYSSPLVIVYTVYPHAHYPNNYNSNRQSV